MVEIFRVYFTHAHHLPTDTFDLAEAEPGRRNAVRPQAPSEIYPCSTANVVFYLSMYNVAVEGNLKRYAVYTFNVRPMSHLSYTPSLTNRPYWK